ncbi:MAG TPA: dTDP-glucose 4,6-dehydratase [Candidatus Kapabacteria bacterium]|nr:dTDP-glucose 4,6-dehydratase [Candidatus Kapabacteria bacterium]
MQLLVTGGAGFIGANFLALALERGHTVTNLDALTYAANLKNCAAFEENNGYRFVHGNIDDAELIGGLMGASRFDAVINFAAESHVDRSIEAASDFAQTNVLGTVRLLEASLVHKVKHFIQISTDEVYGSLGSTGKFTTDSPLKPSSPYSASKAAADHIALSFHHTHGMDVRITRCTNNFGRFQHPEKFIPTIITRALSGQEIPVYGDGNYIRDWIYVEDHCEGVMSVLEKGRAGETYLFGGSTEVDNNTLVRSVLNILERKSGIAGLEQLIRHVTDRPGHDRRYAIDWSGSQQGLGWSPSSDFGSALEKTVDWYLANRDWWDRA